MKQAQVVSETTRNARRQRNPNLSAARGAIIGVALGVLLWALIGYGIWYAFFAAPTLP